MFRTLSHIFEQKKTAITHQAVSMAGTEKQVKVILETKGFIFNPNQIAFNTRGATLFMKTEHKSIANELVQYREVILQGLRDKGFIYRSLVIL